MAGLSLTRETALQIDAVTRETAHQIDAVTRFDGLNPSRRRAQFFAVRTHKCSNFRPITQNNILASVRLVCSNTQRQGETV